MTSFAHTDLAKAHLAKLVGAAKRGSGTKITIVPSQFKAALRAFGDFIPLAAQGRMAKPESMTRNVVLKFPKDRIKAMFDGIQHSVKGGTLIDDLKRMGIQLPTFRAPPGSGTAKGLKTASNVLKKAGEFVTKGLDPSPGGILSKALWSLGDTLTAGLGDKPLEQLGDPDAIIKGAFLKTLMTDDIPGCNLNLGKSGSGLGTAHRKWNMVASALRVFAGMPEHQRPNLKLLFKRPVLRHVAQGVKNALLDRQKPKAGGGIWFVDYLVNKLITVPGLKEAIKTQTRQAIALAQRVKKKLCEQKGVQDEAKRVAEARALGAKVQELPIGTVKPSLSTFQAVRPLGTTTSGPTGLGMDKTGGASDSLSFPSPQYEEAFKFLQTLDATQREEFYRQIRTGKTTSGRKRKQGGGSEITTSEPKRNKIDSNVSAFLSEADQFKQAQQYGL